MCVPDTVHFFFPTKDEEQRRGGKDENKTVESLSLKTNPVLVALSAGRFPEVRPNYEYFAHLLAQNSTVSVRPKTCWVYVSGQQDSGINGNAIIKTEDALNISQYYPLGQSMDSVDGDLPLHEYTNTVAQTYSGPVKEVTKQWKTCFPELWDVLNLPEPQDEDYLTILEMNVTLKLHKNQFPSGAELNGLVEMSIGQPSLQSHQWKCVTRLVRPQELCSDPENAATFLEFTNEVEVQFTHQTGCGHTEDGCDCISKPRHDIRVPFPAAEWASMLTNCASYPEGIPQPARRRRGSGTRAEGDAESGPERTQRELLSQIGMFQELWSSVDGSASGSGWVRRAVVFWKFRDMHQYSAKKKKWVAEAPTTQWRFLTVNDPMSEYHMKNAYVYTGPAPATTEIPSMFASPQLFQESTPTTGEDFMAWNMNATISNHMRSVSAPTGSFNVGEMPGMTPPVTLPNAYPASLESSQDLSQRFGLLPSSCSTESHDGSFVDDVVPTDFLSDGLGMVSGGLMYEGEADTVLQNWEADMKGWVTSPEFDPSLGTGAGAEWGARELWAGEDDWAPPLHMSLRPEWDDIKEEGAGFVTQNTGTGGRVLGKRGREGFEGLERPVRRARTESGMRSVVSRA